MDTMKLPYHTQAVEICIKVVTESSSKVCGCSKRDGFIRATLKSREREREREKRKKEFESKKSLSKWVVGWGKGGKSARERCHIVLCLKLVEKMRDALPFPFIDGLI